MLIDVAVRCRKEDDENSIVEESGEGEGEGEGGENGSVDHGREVC